MGLQLGLATWGRLDWYASLTPFLCSLSPALACSGVGVRAPYTEVQACCVVCLPSPQAGGRSLTSAQGLPREPGPHHCFAQRPSSYLPPSGANKPSGLQAPAQLTTVDFYSASRLQKHALEPKPAKPACCSFCVSWTTAVLSRDGVPASTDFKITLTSPMSSTLAMLVRG